MKVLDQEGLGFYHNKLMNEIYCPRVNKIIISEIDYCFFNPANQDLSMLPLDTLLITETGESGYHLDYYLRYIEGKYKLQCEMREVSYTKVFYEGTSKSDMSLVSEEYIRINAQGNGAFAKVTYMNETYQNIFDNLMRINKSF